MTTAPKVDIVVLNWNGWEDTIECLESLFQMTYGNYRVVLVDNGSTDGSIERIKDWASGKRQVQSKYFIYDPNTKPIPVIEHDQHAPEAGRGKEPLIIIRLKENIGFARGNNVGIKYALSDPEYKYILALNNDTIVRPDFLERMMDVFKEHPKAGLLGPKIVDYYSGKHWQGVMLDRIDIFTTIMFFTPLKIFFNRVPMSKRYLLPGRGAEKVYGIAGCCMLFKSKILEEIGLFDETTFLGWEEYIIAEKLLKRGYETYAAAESIIYHKVARDTVRREPVEKTIIFLRSERYFQEKYLKMPAYQRLMIKAIRLIAYSIIAVFNKQFRNNYINLMNAILERKG